MEENTNHATSPENKAASLDPRSVLLPKGAAPSLDSIQRVEAGALYAQEQSATLPPPPPAQPLPTPPVVGSEFVEPLETYQSDMQKYVNRKQISKVKVVAAEQIRRGQEGKPVEVTPVRAWSRQAGVLAGSTLLLALATGGLIYVYFAMRAYPSAATPTAHFIAVDETTPVPVLTSHSDLMQALVSSARSTKLAVGLIEALIPESTGPTTHAPLTASAFMQALAPNLPDTLARTLEPDFLLGIHSFDVNQPFLILSVDSYEQGYAGMLAWEPKMQQDLAPLFTYTPVEETHTVPLQTDTSASSTAGAFASTTVGSLPQVLAGMPTHSPFSDAIVENHDARVIKNSAGSTVLLWTFLDRSTILITTNPSTVKEIITRLKTAPTLPAPGQ